MHTGYELHVTIVVGEVKGFRKVPYVRYRFLQASHYSESKPRVLLTADINTTSTPNVFHSMWHCIMVPVMAYDVKG